METIVAIASPSGPAARGVLRLSGPDTAALLNRALVEPTASTPRVAELTPETPRCVRRLRLDDGRGEQPALLYWMPGPHSYTREDTAELHLVGSEPLLARAFERFLSLGARRAGPGEFTRRAFENGRIDLTQAEGVLELVSASNEGERRAALRLLEGGLSGRLFALREALEDLRALCEASLDFDESDTGHVETAELEERMADIARRLDRARSWEVRRQPPATLPRVVLYGAPNAGKSSLFNALSGEIQALVSETAGTTRDTVAKLWSLDRSDRAVGSGPLCLLIDSPGWEGDVRGPDATAQRLAAREREGADLILWVADASTEAGRHLEPLAAELPAGVPRLVCWNKLDLEGARLAVSRLSRAAAGPAGPTTETPVQDVAISAEDRTGLDELRRAVACCLGFEAEGATTAPGSRGGRAVAQVAGAGGLARELFARHLEALALAADELSRAREELAGGVPLDLVSETLRDVTRALDSIAGRTSPEDLLDRIFARFCLGK